MELTDISGGKVPAAVFLYEPLAPFKVVAEENVEHLAGSLHIGGVDLYKVSGFMVVRLIMSGSFSPRPLLRCMVYFASPIMPSILVFSGSV